MWTPSMLPFIEQGSGLCFQFIPPPWRSLGLDGSASHRQGHRQKVLQTVMSGEVWERVP